jgi:cytochrome c biogenesis protein CcmG, thiol:disulfide interchange protein DsbE
MKEKILTLLFIIAVFTFAIAREHMITPVAPAYAPAAQAAAQPLPAISFAATDGKTYDLGKLPEKGIVLHFWASWCAPCAVEFPVMLKKIADANGDLALVAVSIDDKREDMDKFVKKLGGQATAPHVYWVWDKDKDISVKQFDTVKAPETVLIDAKRRMTAKIAGDAGWDTPAMAEKLRALALP